MKAATPHGVQPLPSAITEPACLLAPVPDSLARGSASMLDNTSRDGRRRGAHRQCKRSCPALQLPWVDQTGLDRGSLADAAERTPSCYAH
jgi:hypothetical protein